MTADLFNRDTTEWWGGRYSVDALGTTHSQGGWSGTARGSIALL